MTCKDVSEFLADYLDGTLPWRQRLFFSLHLWLCRRCRQYVASYAATVRMTRSLDSTSMEEVPEEIVRAILAARRGESPARSDSRRPGPQP